MARGAVNWRWLTSAGFAAALCALSIITAMSLPGGSDSSQEIFSGLAWLSAIATVFCAVRAGFDLGVHRTVTRSGR